jgi:MYXO-CTERM domain-containing protein
MLRGAMAATLLAALLTCGAAGAAGSRTDVCYQGGALLPNFQLNGSALLNGTDLVVTNNMSAQNASIMYLPRFASTADLHVQLQLRISQVNAGGADGMAFVMHTDPRGAGALATAGGGIGYGGGNNITPSVVVELDTYQNGYDPNNNHIGIMLDGDETNHRAVYTPGFDMRAVSSFYVWVDYTAAMTQLDVYVSQSSTKPGAPQLSYSVDVAQHFGNQPFYMGFTGSTGGAQEQHEIVSFIASDSAITSQVCCTQDTDCNGSPLGKRCDQIKHVCGQCSITDTKSCAVANQGCDIGPPSNTCITPCTGDYGSGGAAACPTASAAVCVMSGPAKGSCTSCNGNNGSGASQACPAVAPVCSLASGFCGFPCTSDAQCGGAAPVCNATSGACVQCSPAKKTQCQGLTPACDANTNTCTGCKSDSDCGGATPACNSATGACVQCSATNGVACTGSTPTCNVKTNTCTGCTSDADCGGPTGACNTTTYLCVQCTASNQLACAGTTAICNLATNTCTGCTSDSECSGSTPFCDTMSGTCGACTDTDTSQCPDGQSQCKQVNFYRVCEAPPPQSGCACNVVNPGPPADVAAVAMALLLSVRRRRRKAA